MVGSPPMSRWFILASGPSMSHAMARAVRGAGYVVAINETIELAPWADLHYACDVRWWVSWLSRNRGRILPGKRACLRPPFGCVPMTVDGLAWEDKPGLGLSTIHSGMCSGYQAVNLAYLEGATEIFLLGYDMRHIDGKAHWHPDHPSTFGNFGMELMPTRIETFGPLARDLARAGVRVVNCTPLTALECFEKMSLDQVL